MSQKLILPPWTELFHGVQYPSVKIFESKMEGLSPAERQCYIEQAFRDSLSRYDISSERMRLFFRNFANSNRQDFLNYLHNRTLLSELRYTSSNPEMLYKTAYLLEAEINGRMATKELAFAILLSFNYPYALSTFHRKLRSNKFDDTDLKEMSCRLAGTIR